MGERRFMFLLGSARGEGNSEQLARLAAASLPAGAHAKWLDVSALKLPSFVDHRHSDPSLYVMPEGDERVALEATLWATDLVFVAPTYWYNLPAPLKLYLDHWSGWLRVKDVEFKHRLAGGTLWTITVNSDAPGDDSSSAPLVQALQLTADYMGLTFGGALIGHANRPGEVKADAAAVAAAAHFFSARSP